MSLSGFWWKLYCYCGKTALRTPCSAGEDVQKRTVVWKTPLLLFLAGHWEDAFHSLLFSLSRLVLVVGFWFGFGFICLVFWGWVGFFGCFLSSPKIALRFTYAINCGFGKKKKKKKNCTYKPFSAFSVHHPLQNHPMSKISPCWFIGRNLASKLFICSAWRVWSLVMWNVEQPHWLSSALMTSTPITASWKGSIC